MKIFLQITTVLFLTVITSKAQTVLYADSVIAFSSNYYQQPSSTTPGWSELKILGSPDVYPSCGDILNAWTTPLANTRDWIVLHYPMALKVDTIKIYETNSAGAVDTVYLRNASTLLWNVVYIAPAIQSNFCNVLTIAMPQTVYYVDALRFSLNSGISNYSEYDAVALKNNSITTSIKKTEGNTSFLLYPNPSQGKFTIKLNNEIVDNSLKIYSLLGNIVYEQKLVNENETINTNLTKGVYFIEVTNFSNKKFVNKLIIE